MWLAATGKPRVALWTLRENLRSLQKRARLQLSPGVTSLWRIHRQNLVPLSLPFSDVYLYPHPRIPKAVLEEMGQTEHRCSDLWFNRMNFRMQLTLLSLQRT